MCTFFKLAMLLAIIIAVHHLKATLSASAEGQKGKNVLYHRLLRYCN
jgi:hypothetical protein